MTWSLVGTPTTTEVTTNNPFGVLPTGTQNGDLIVAWVAYRNVFQFTQPGGWTAVGPVLPNPDALTSGGTAGIQVFWIQRGASDPPVQFGWSGISIGASAIIRIAAFRSSIAGTLIAQPLSGGAPWTPADISNGLIGWYDGNDASTLTFSGSNLTQWRDKSAAANHAVPFGTGPTQAILNSKNALLFANSGLHTTTPISFNDFTATVVFRATLPGWQERLVDHSLANGWWIGRNASTEAWGGGVQENSDPYGRFVSLSPSVTVASGAQQITSKRFGAIHSISGNGFPPPSSAIGTVTTAATSSNWIGIGTSYTDDTPLDNDILAEILIWNRALPIWEQARLEGYLGFKWGIFGQMTFSHLYRQIPPVTGLPTQSIFQTASVVAGGAVSSIGSVVPTADGALLILGCAGGDNGTWTGLSTANIASGNWTALGSSYGTDAGGGVALHGAYYIQTTAADTGNVQATLSVDGRNALALVSFQEFTNETSCRPVGTNITNLSVQAVTGGSTVAACSASFSGTSALAATGRARITWSFIGVTTIEGTGSITGTLPAGTQTGDLLVAMFAYRGATGFGGSGWNLVGTGSPPGGDTVTSGGVGSLVVYWLQHGATAPALSWFTSGQVGILRLAVFRPSVAGTLIAQPRVGGVPWSPSDIPTGLTSWFDSSDAATLTFAGANVTQWGDKSPAGNHAFPFVSGPTITIFDSKPMLFIDGAVSAMHTTVARSYGDFTAAVFFKKGTDQQFQRLIDTEIDTGFWLGRGPNSGQWGGGVIEISSPFGQYIGLGSPEGVLSLARLGNQHTVSVGSLSATKTGSTTTAASQVLGIGSTYFGSTNTGDQVAIGEILIWTRALPDWEKDRLDGYLAHKWNQQGGLTSSHQFRSTRPVSGPDTQSIYRTPTVVSGGSLSSTVGITPQDNDALLILAAAGGDNGTWSGLSTANIGAGNWSALDTDYGTETGAGTALTSAYYVQGTPAPTGAPQVTLSVDGQNALALVSFQLLTNETSSRIANGGTVLSATVQAVTGGTVVACSASFSGASNFGPNDFGVASCSPVLSGVSILNPSTAIIAPCSVAFTSSSTFNPAAMALLPPIVACSASLSGGTRLVANVRGNWNLIGTPTTSAAVASGAVTGTLPTGTATGDLIVAWINYRGSATFATPAGWTLVGTQATNADLAATSGIAGIAFYLDTAWRERACAGLEPHCW